ncbi:BPSL0067 family protein [Falsiroseomonas selenitidurans]|uniref:BPSL0067 family protein n=1 Tax=Falsiroseomonas selenitidurans TaxID=2716335 RepID=A0ABX1DXG5_9PROT|nr:BPSL0067 family protein [Falsiroseomonas selenitidurans]NKC29568.1 BPSL0067 family protein [Falsiroseomonas selenitidurans]
MSWSIDSVMCGNSFLGYVYRAHGGSFAAWHCGLLQQQNTAKQINQPGKPYVSPKSAEEILKMADADGFVSSGADAGSGQCVALVKAAVPALGATKDWKTKASRWCKAEKVTETSIAGLAAGTVIGYGFDAEGKYASLSSGNHVAILVSSTGSKATILDQWKSAAKKTEQKAKTHVVDITTKDWYVVTLCAS